MMMKGLYGQLDFFVLSLDLLSSDLKIRLYLLLANNNALSVHPNFPKDNNKISRIHFLSLGKKPRGLSSTVGYSSLCDIRLYIDMNAELQVVLDEWESLSHLTSHQLLPEKKNLEKKRRNDYLKHKPDLVNSYQLPLGHF